MDKRKLVSLLAIPIFSLTTAFNSFGQESGKIKSKEVAASVIDFFLKNPKTADKMKPHESVALGILSNLLKTSGQREHEMEYATAGRSQITINTPDNRQAQFVKDEGGNIFLVVEGVIYPISQELINQASTISSSHNLTLSSYNLGDLERKFMSNPKENVSQNYQTLEGGEYLFDIADKFDVPISNIFYWGGDGKILSRKTKLYPIIDQKVLQNKKKIKKHTSLGTHPFYNGNLHIVKEKVKNEILTVFSYKWDRDLNNDGSLSFNEFNQIKRVFYNDEDFNIAIRYQTEKYFRGNVELKIFDDSTGKLVFDQKLEKILEGSQIGLYPIPAGTFPVGLYLIHANLLKSNANAVSSNSEKFEIIERDF